VGLLCRAVCGVNGFPVVALVCSAGGVEALTAVLKPLPADLNAAVLVLRHMPPDYGSALDRVLARQTVLPVAFAADGAALVRGQVLVAPPGQHTIIDTDGSVVLIPSGNRPPYRPSADLLLATLATSYRRRAVAVVLSGGGNDGATGATVVHRLGGTVIAATVATSAHGQMPQATIDRDDVLDQAVPVTEIAALLEVLASATLLPPPDRGPSTLKG
jgi:two-component system chemotaxis response regulator CheB